MKDKIQDLMERPKRYDNIDGTGEMFMGLMILAFALIGCLQVRMPKDYFWQRHSLIFMYAVLLPVLGLGFLLQKLIKRTVTWPRTGYVAFPKAGRALATRMIWPGILGFVIAVAVALVFVPLALIGKTHAVTMTVTRLLYAGLFVAPYAFWICKMGSGHRRKWFMLVLMALVLILIGLIAPGGFFESFFPWAALFVGLTWVLSGLETLVSYLNHNQMPARQAE